ncbi:ATP-binding protein [Metaclostridioides mangenotii]|uniref:ATP-binding protein n=1 Tax=Metaclostridioides mangenotii TaxID=1540 RepID=UPI000487485A|nr:4Fe-4S binding protein [Clostridioides mangenotii]
MIRTIIKIDKDKCNGCGLCIDACHENAMAIIDGKATLIRDDYCDGLGHCMPACPMDALSFEEREALPYDEEAVLANTKAKEEVKKQETMECGCPGSMAKSIDRTTENDLPNSDNTLDDVMEYREVKSSLNQWPVQIKLVPVNAPYFNGANLLVAADCTAYSYGNFHNKFMKNKVTLIGCPKLDEVDYTNKLTEILKLNDINSLVVTRMEVPCCSGITNAVKKALQNSGKVIPWKVVTISTDGKIIDEL